MSKDITYRCNLCREQVPSVNAIVGIFFEGVHDIKPVQPINAENHLCNKCIKSIGDQIENLASFWAAPIRVN